MTKVLVVYGSRHGATRGIAERIGVVLRTEGAEAFIAPADHVAPDHVRTADAYVVGSGVYMGSWLSEPLEFLRTNHEALASRPTWLFSSGPIPGSSKEQPDADPLTNALGPADGPGSGGRKKVEAVTATIHPRGHRVFLGAFDPADPPRTLSERIIRLLPAARKVLPPGDYRDWEAIMAWAREIAVVLRSLVPVG